MSKSKISNRSGLNSLDIAAANKEGEVENIDELKGCGELSDKYLEMVKELRITMQQIARSRDHTAAKLLATEALCLISDKCGEI